jgi:tetraacyldisaccharide 4'-kinase
MRIILSPLLWPLVLLYRFFSYFHHLTFRLGMRHVVKLPKPVISVGNLTVGGTGKTAVVDYILTQIEILGLRCCVLTRGYGRKSKETIIVSNSSTAAEVGDEPLWLYQRHPTSKILVSPERAEAATKVTDVDIFIMDDGLQHFELERDYEIILIDSTRPDWHYNVLPLGFARESWSALKRADLVVLTRANQVPEARIDTIAERIFKTVMVDVSECFINFEQCEDIRTGQPLEIKNTKVFLVSGIANPRSFEKLVMDNEAQIVGHKVMDDHYVYTLESINEYIKQAQSVSAQLIMITEKDAVKWQEIFKAQGTQVMEFPIGIVWTSLLFDPPLESVYDMASHGFH